VAEAFGEAPKRIRFARHRPISQRSSANRKILINKVLVSYDERWNANVEVIGVRGESSKRAYAFSMMHEALAIEIREKQQTNMLISLSREISTFLEPRDFPPLDLEFH